MLNGNVFARAIEAEAKNNQTRPNDHNISPTRKPIE
jgi:hypothetical protein